MAKLRTTHFKRLVIKLGTSLLTAGTPHLNPRRMLEIVRQVAVLHERGAEVIMVSSGAVAAGREQLGNPDLGRYIPAKQMLSAIGQPRLMHAYSDIFALFGIQVAQVLLTEADFRNRQRYLNARDTLLALLAYRVIPIINENDTVATDELRLGDNDNLSALAANLTDADLLVMLTDQPGLFSSNPRTDPNARLINLVEIIDEDVLKSAQGAGSAQGTGGMITKLEAAQLATRSGTTVVIAQGSCPDVLPDLIGEGGADIGTWFQPVSSRVESRKRWLLSEQPQGKIRVDEGAARKLVRSTASLLPVGVVAIEGNFERGVVVSVCGPEGREVARGLTNYNAGELARLCGAKSKEIEARLGYTYGDEVILRDRLVIIER
jgi:glutamate 5-kinase